MSDELTFKLNKDPYMLGYDLFRDNEITIYPGRLTVLVGCNGCGKSTIIHQINEQVRSKKYTFITFDNLKDGGQNAIVERTYQNDFQTIAELVQSSEGECITITLGTLAQKIGVEVSHHPTRPIVITLDAIDSGLSIDNIIEFKEFVQFVIEQNKNVPVYVIVSANEYEMASEEDCIMCTTLHHVKFETYQSYKSYIIGSKEFKDNNIQKMRENGDRELFKDN